MDHIDTKIVSLLQENARMPARAMTSEVFLSPPAITARIDKLETQGIIQGYHAQVDIQKLGYHIIAFISMDISVQQKKDFYPFISACPNVLECNCVTGQYSMLIKVAFPTTQDLDDFIGKLQRYGNTSTQIVFSSPVPARHIRIVAEE